MSDLKKCKREGCKPLLQTRGAMKPEDHHKQFARYGAVRNLVQEHGVHVLDLDEYRRDAYEVENEEEHAADMRISCAMCGLASPWMRRDVEEFRPYGPGDNRRHIKVRDGNVDAIRRQWNGMVK